MRRLRLALLCVLVSGISLGAPGGAAAAPSEGAIQAAMDERASFGLPSDRGTIIDLLASGRDVGSGMWGIPMTAEEEKALDLRGRMSFFLELEGSLLPFVRSLPSYGGGYVDQPAGGSIVVLLTEVDPAVEAAILARVPEVNRGAEIRVVKHTYAELQDAVIHARETFAEVTPTADLFVVALDSRSNSVRVEVDPGDLELVEGSLSAVEARLGVPVFAVAGSPTVEDVCNSRDNCHTPMKAGIRIRKNDSGGALCTMAFHIRIGSDEQFTTAGHCGHVGQNNWWHNGFGNIGGELATQYAQNGRDAMRVQMPDAQASDDVYNDSPNIVGSGNPVTGMAICASLGNTNTIDCGTVSDDFLNWTGDACGCNIFGADHNSIATQGGDSGSPLYVIGGGSSEPATGYGIHNTASGGFARFRDVLNAWGASIVT